MWNHDGDRCVFPLKWSDVYDLNPGPSYEAKAPQCETRPRIGVISPPDDIRGVKVTTLFGVAFFYWFFFLVTADCRSLERCSPL